MSKSVKKHYIDNVRFSEESARHAALFREHRKLGLSPPKMNDYLGRCILLLANKIVAMPAYSGYSFKEEMVSDGIEICLRYFYNYNPEVISERTGQPSAGAHSFFTQIICRRFFKTRSENKLQMYIREKFIAESDDHFADMQSHDEPEHQEALKDILEEMSGDAYIAFDQKQAIKKAELREKQIAKKRLKEVDLVKEEVVLPMDEFF
jgi:hypothetical protein